MPPGYVELDRDNILTTLDVLLDAHRAVRVSGEVGSGRSTVLRQYQASRPSLSIRMDAGSRSSYTPAAVTATLAAQLAEQLGTTVATENLRYAFARYSQRLSKDGRVCTIVVDGYDDVEESDRVVRDSVFECLPGDRTYRVLIESSSTIASFETHDYHLAPFTRLEFGEVLRPKAPLECSVVELYKATAGAPGQLSAICRMLDKGYPGGQIMSAIERYGSALKSEWELNGVMRDDVLRTALSVLAFTLTPLSISGLASITKESSATILSSLQKCPFLVVSRDGSNVSFADSLVRRHARSVLTSERKGALKSLAGSERDLATENAYAEAGNDGERILAHTSPQCMKDIYESEGSIVALQDRLMVAADWSVRNQSTGDALRACATASAILDAGVNSTDAEMVRALYHIGDVQVSLARAYAATPSENRLVALSAYARCCRDTGIELTDELQRELRSLVDKITPDSLRVLISNGMDDLLLALPKLFFEAALKAKKSKTGSDFFAEMAMTGVRAIAAGGSGQADAAAIAKTVRDAMGGRGPAEVADRVAVLVGSRTGEEIERSADEIDDEYTRLYLKRVWCSRNARRTDSLPVAVKAFEGLIASSEIAVSAVWLDSLSRCLPYARSTETREHFVRLLRAQLPRIKEVGPSENYITTLIQIALRSNNESVVEELEEAYMEASDLSDIAAKVTSLARLLQAIRADGSSVPVNPATAELEELVHSELSSVIPTVLSSSADHRSALEGAVRAIGVIDTRWALEVCSLANSRMTRDGLRAEVVRALTWRLANVDGNVWMDLRKSFESTAASSECILALLGRVKNSGRSLELLAMERLRDWVIELPYASSRCSAACLLLEIAERQPEASAVFRLGLADEIERSAGDVVALDLRRSSLLKASAAIAGFDCTRARLLVERCSPQPWLSQSAPAKFFLFRCAVRIVRQLAAHNGLSDSDLDSVALRVSSLGCAVDRLVVWADLAIAIYHGGDSERARRIFRERIRPDLEATLVSDIGSAASVAELVAPAAVAAEGESGMDYFAALPRAEVDSCVLAVSVCLLREVSPLDESSEAPWRGRADQLYSVLRLVLKLAHRLSSDHEKFVVLQNVYSAVGDEERRIRFLTGNQILQVAQLMEDVVESLSPDDAVKHDGYELVGRARIFSLRGLKPNDQSWQDLLRRARAIPNVADRSFVLSDLAGVVPRALRRDARDMLSEATELLREMNVASDRFHRYHQIAETAFRVDRQHFEDTVRAGLRAASELEALGEEVWRERRRMVDLAFRLDPEFAERLIDELDDDPRRSAVRLAMAYKAETKKQEKLLSEGATDKIDVGMLEIWSATCLSEFNVGRSAGPQIEMFLPGLRRVGWESISSVHSVFELACGVLVERIGRRSAGVSELRLMLNGFMESVSTLEQVLGGRSAPVVGAGEMTSADGVIVAPQQRDVAESFLAAWFDSCGDEQIVFVDPYFSLADLGLIQIFYRSRASGDLRIVAGPSFSAESGGVPTRNEVERRWKELSADPLPRFEVVVVSTIDTLRCPLHDRWVLTSMGGLRLGTSFSGFGKRVSEISRVGTEKTLAMLEVVERYCSGVEQFLEDERVTTTCVRM